MGHETTTEQSDKKHREGTESDRKLTKRENFEIYQFCVVFCVS
jgi:hypothetical protein